MGRLDWKMSACALFRDGTNESAQDSWLLAVLMSMTVLLSISLCYSRLEVRRVLKGHGGAPASLQERLLADLSILVRVQSVVQRLRGLA